jgi:hypothetical protein
MTRQEFEPLFQKITDKYPNHFKDEEQTAREFSDWFQTFERHPVKLVTDSFSYYLTHLAGPFHPEIPIIINCMNRIWKEKQQTACQVSTDGKRDKGEMKLIRALSATRDKLNSGEVQGAYTNNERRASSHDTKNIKNMAESFSDVFVRMYLEPHVRIERKLRLEEERIDRPANDLTQGRYCYYCGNKTYRPNLGKQVKDPKDASVKIAEYFVCDKCEVKFFVTDTSQDNDDLPF